MSPAVEGFLGGKVVNDTHLDYVTEAEVKARRLIDAHVILVVYPTSGKYATKIVAESAAAKLEGRDGAK